MNRRLTLLVILMIGLTLGSPANSREITQLQPSAQPKARDRPAADPAHPPYQRQDKWYEFVLKQFNPDEFDYGRWVERERRVFEARLKDPHFLYGQCTTLVLLLMTVICAKLWIDHRRAMWITAEMMADIYNQDAYSRRIAQEAIEKYNTHIERCNRAIEAAEHGETASATGSEIDQLRGELICVAHERDTATRERDLAREQLRKKSEILAEMSIRLEALTKQLGVAVEAKRSPDLQGVDARLVTHINNLQEQLYAARNNNRKLRGG